jgi:phage gp36-like protein
MLKVGIKYCGGCNPYYDRVALVKQIESRLRGKVEFVSPHSDHVDFVLAVEGCQTACADLSAFQGKTIHIISRKEDAVKFLQKIQNQQ